MKHTINYVMLLAMGLFMLACGDKANFLDSVTPATGARVRFYHMAPDLAGVDIYVNDQKFSGVNTIPPAVAAPISYTNSFPNQDYAVLTPGTAKVKIIVPASTTATTDATVATADLTAQADTYYSVFLYGVAPTYSTLTLTDNLTAADPTKAYVRLVNFVSGTDASATYDLVVNGAAVVTGVAPLKGAATFVAIPSIGYNSTAVPVQVRPTSTTVVTASTTLQPNAGRFYTYVVRGVVGGTGAKAITVNGIANPNTINR